MTAWLVENTDLSPLGANLLLSVVLLLLLVGTWAVTVRAIAHRVDDVSVNFHARRATSYVLAAIGIVGLLGLWVTELRTLGTFLGLATAGIAIALSDLLRNIAGWIFLILRRPYHVDDRVQIGDVAGDVINIRLFRTTLLEIGNWVDADQSTGRTVHVPNGHVLSKNVFNATEGFGYIWHEIPVRITFESDWQRGEELFLRVLDEEAGHTAEEARERLVVAARNHNIRYTHLSPAVYLTVRENGILLTGRILVDPRRRRSIEQQVWRALLREIAAEPDVQLAYPTTRTYLAEPLRVTDDAADGERQRRGGLT